MTATAMANELVSLNPATGEPVGSVPVTPTGSIEEILLRSRAAQTLWAALDLDERLEMLHRVIPVLEKRAEEIGRLVTA